MLETHGAEAEGKGELASGNIHCQPRACTQVVTPAGSMVSDPSLGCSSLLKKILYYNNNNMNFSLIFCFFPFLLGTGVEEERKKKCHSSVRS